MTRIPVLFLTGSLRMGGTERNILHLATHLDPARFRVEVWSDYEGEPIQTELRARGIVCRALKGRPSLGEPVLKRLFLRNLPYQFRLWRMLCQRRRAVVHAFGFPMAYFAVLLGRLAGCRRVIFSVQDWDVWKCSGLYALLDRLCSRLAWRVVADGEGARRLAVTRQGMDARRMVTMYDGANAEELVPTRPREETRRQLGLAPDRVALGVIARLDVKKKGQDVFVAAAAQAAAQAPEAQFVIVGDGPDRAEIERLILALPEPARPLMAGFRTDLADVLAALDALVIPSRWESVPKILLEAMWLERPILATTAGDIPEILDDHCGILAPVDDPAALAAGMVELARDPALRQQLGRAGRRLLEARGLRLSDTVKAYEKMYSG